MQVFVILALISLLIFAQYSIYRKFALYEVRAGIRFSSSTAECGETVMIFEEIENRKRLPLVQILLRFEAPRELSFPDMTNTALSDLYYREDLISLGGWKRHVRQITVRCRKRGYYTFKRFTVTTCDLLMLMKFHGSFSSNSSLTVLPRYLNTPDVSALFMSAIGERVNRYSLVNNPFTFSAIREYQPYDSLNRINWNATVRKDELMVNTSDNTISPEITILLNVARYSPDHSTECIEKAISLAYSFSVLAARESIPVSVHANSRDIRTGESVSSIHGTGKEHARQIGQALAGIDLDQVPTPFENLLNTVPGNLRNRQLIILSPNYDTGLQKEILRLTGEGARAVWIVPCAVHEKTPRILPEIRPIAILWEERYNG